MEKRKKNVPAIVIKRLPRYYRYLTELKNQDVKRISSSALSEKMDVTASQIRQDLNYFGGFGQQGYGYSVEHLHHEIGKLLGVNSGHKTIIVGAGNLGHAIANYTGFIKRGFTLCAIFDNNEDIIGREINGIEVMHSDLMEQFIKDNDIDIAILTLPKNVVQQIADRLVDSGIKGLWNFSYAELKTKKDVAIETVHLADSLMTLSYKINQGDNQ